MPKTIKLEEVVSENQDNEFSDSVSIDSYNNLQCQNENLQLLLSISKETCSDQESKLIDFKYQISNLEEQISNLKRENKQSADIIANRSNVFNILCDTIQNLDSKNNYSVTDPKSALIKLNDMQKSVKALHNKVTDNKIIIMTMCKILGCADTRIVQSLKDIISENETNKQKYKTYEQFYRSSQKAIDQISVELHRNGYDLPLANNSLHHTCSIHRESFDNWNHKMANLRENSMGIGDKLNGKSPIMKRDNNSNQKKAENTFPCIPTDFYRQFPPPDFSAVNIDCPVGGTSPLVPCPPAQLQVNTRIPQDPRKRTSQQLINNPIIIDSQTSNDTNGSSAFQINSNVFDWKNDVVEGQIALMKLERKMLEPSSSKADINLSPSLSLVEDGLEMNNSHVRMERYLRLNAKYLSLKASHQAKLSELQEAKLRVDFLESTWFPPNKLRCLTEKSARLQRRVEEHRLTESLLRIEIIDLRLENNQLAATPKQSTAESLTSQDTRDPLPILLPHPDIFSSVTTTAAFLKQDGHQSSTQGPQNIKPKRKRPGQKKRAHLRQMKLEAEKQAGFDNRMQALANNDMDFRQYQEYDYRFN